MYHVIEEAIAAEDDLIRARDIAIMIGDIAQYAAKEMTAAVLRAQDLAVLYGEDHFATIEAIKDARIAMDASTAMLARSDQALQVYEVAKAYYEMQLVIVKATIQ